MLTLETQDFTLKDTFECGQCFRFKRISLNEYIIQTRDVVARIIQNDNVLHIYSTYEEPSFWRQYLDLDTNYSLIKQRLSNDVSIKKAIEYGSGIHILRQNFQEMLISYIMSQNKQIPQIQQCITLFCQKYGEPISFESSLFFSFPKSFLNITIEGLRECKVGFRDKYLMDAIEKLNQGYFNGIEDLLEKEQEERLLMVKGVGPKVMNCIMLFGLYNTNRFPIDTWIKKEMQKLYFDDKEIKNEKIEKEAEKLFGEYKGYAQQYLFFAGRNGII